MGNNASKPLENQLGHPSRIQLNDDTNFDLTLSTAAMDFEDSLNCENNEFFADRMLTATPAQSPVCADFLGKVGGDSRIRGQVMLDDSDDIVTAGPRFSDFLDIQVKRNLSNADAVVASGVHPGSLCDEETLRYFNADAVNSDDTMNFSWLFDDIQGPLVDINTGSNTDVQEHCIGGSAIDTGIARVYGSGMDDNNILSLPAQLNTMQTQQVGQSNATVGGDNARVRTVTQGGTSTFPPQVHNEIRFPSLFDFRTPQTERNSINNGNRRSHTSQTNTQGEPTSGTSHVQPARSNNGNSISVSGQYHNLQSPEINRSPIRNSNKRANAVQSGRPGETRTGRFVVHDFTQDADEDTRFPTLCSNFAGQEINISSISNEGGLLSRMPADSKDRLTDETFLRSKALTFNESHSSMFNRKFTGITGDTLKVHQSQIPVNVNEDLCYSDMSSEQVGNSYLNHGFGGLSYPSTFQSNTSGEANRSFLSLGGTLGDRTLSNQANTIVCGTNAGVSSNPYISLGGNLENPSWLENVRRTISRTNTGVNLRKIPETVQGNAQPNTWRPSGRTSGSGGNLGGMYVNSVPKTGFQGYPDLINKSGLHANEQVRMSNLAVGPSSLPRFPNRSVSTTPQQAYINDVRHISTNSSLPSPLISGASRTSEQGQSGNPILIDDSIAEAAKGINLSFSNNQAQTDQGTTRICGRGKRVPADGIHYGQSSKVLLGPSVSGKPVPVARHVGLAQTSEGLLGQTIPRMNAPNASTVFRAPRGRKMPQPPLNSFIPYGDQTRKIYHPPVMSIPFGSQIQNIAQLTPNPYNLPATQTRTLQPSADLSKVSGSKHRTVHHIKWGGPRELVQLIGEKCHICKRDLTYTATGPVTQPETPPSVAVLPCGHTFHDECLERITPDDQLKQPPCIPCAIGTS